MKSKPRINSRIILIMLIFFAFIALGMPDSLSGVAWPSIRAGFKIPLDSLGMLMIASTCGYILSTFLNGFFIKKVGVGGVLAASCGLTGITLISYTLVPQWWMMVALGIFGGFGAGAIDAGLNTYAAENFHEGLMQWLHASYGVGVTFGPIIMTLGLNKFSTWHFGYIVVGAFQIALGVIFLLTLPMWKTKVATHADENVKKISEYKTPYSETFRQPAVWISMLLFFFYVGAEMGLGAWAYSFLTESREISVKVAGYLAGSFYLMFTIGRALAGLYARRVGTHTLVKASVAGALTGSILMLINVSDIVTIIGLALVGFSIAPIFAAMVSGTTERVGAKYAANTVGLQMSASGASGAVLPPLMGVLSRHISLEVVPICLCIFFITLFILYTVSMNLAQTRKLQESTQETNQTLQPETEMLEGD